MSNWVFSTHNPRQNITMYSNNLTNKNVPDCKPVLKGILGTGRDGTQVIHVIHKDGWDSAMKIIPHWDRKTDEEKRRIEQEFRWLDDERMYHQHIFRARDAFVVKGDVHKKLYSNEWKYTRSTLQDGSKAVYQVDEEKVVPQPEADVCGESYCMVMEVHTNGTIEEEIAAKNKAVNETSAKLEDVAYTEEQIWTLLTQITAAVGTMHWVEQNDKALYVLHRNIRTSNILCRDLGCCGVKMGGFSLVGPESEHIELAKPTNKDMEVWPSERIKGEKVTHKCDIFMLGAVIYEMMALRPIHEVKDNNVSAFMKEIADGKIEHVANVMARNYSRDLVSLVMLMLHKDAAKRPEVIELMALIRQLRPEVYDEGKRSVRIAGDTKYERLLAAMEEKYKAVPKTRFSKSATDDDLIGASHVDERSHNLVTIMESLTLAVSAESG